MHAFLVQHPFYSLGLVFSEYQNEVRRGLSVHESRERAVGVQRTDENRQIAIRDRISDLDQHPKTTICNRNRVPRGSRAWSPDQALAARPSISGLRELVPSPLATLFSVFVISDNHHNTLTFVLVSDPNQKPESEPHTSFRTLKSTHPPLDRKKHTFTYINKNNCYICIQ